MVSGEPGVPQNRPPARALGPPWKKGRQKSKGKVPWYQHAAWLIPTVACIQLAVLIAGAFGVRQLIIVLREPAEGAQTNADVDAATESPSPSTGEGRGEGGSGVSPAASQKPDEPELEVLPPPAAKQPGRKLPKMLLVGPGVDMFPLLEEALQYAIGGDVIEIRSNGTLAVEPGKAVWDGTEGLLTIRAGKGFRPVLVRASEQSGALLRLGPNGKPSTARCIVEDLTFVNMKRLDPEEPNYSNPIINPFRPLWVRGCVFITDVAGVMMHYRVTPETELTVEGCYFRAVRRGDQETRAVGIGEGRLSVRNNLFVGFTVPVTVGGGVDRLLPPQSDVVLEHNTLAHCAHPPFAYARTVLRSRDNLFCHHTSQHFCGLGSHVNSAEEAHQRIDYRGERNLYFQVNFDVWQGWLPPDSARTMAGWQWLTNNGEQRAILADPLFANPQLVMQAKDQMLPPAAFGLRAESPARGAASDGTDIGCDLSRIPTPPPIVEQLVQQMLRGE